MTCMITFLRRGLLFLALAALCASTSFAAAEKGTADYSQIIFVAAERAEATVSMYAKQGDGHWQKLLQAPGYICKNGLGKTRDGDGKTPVGVFGLPSAFGSHADPGTALPYQLVTDQQYWVDDSHSRYYNQMVGKDNAVADWHSGEHIVDYPVQYAYAIVIGYNKACTPDAGSGIFLHCSAGRPTAGCVAISTRSMVALLQQIEPGCVISIGPADVIEKQIQALVK